MKAASTKKAKRPMKLKALPPRKDPKGGGSPVSKIAINHNEVLMAEGAWIG